MTSRRPARRVNVWPAAQKDAQRLNDDDPRLGVEIAAIIRLLERGADGYDLQSMPKYGDLSAVAYDRCTQKVGVASGGRGQAGAVGTSTTHRVPL